MKNFLLGLSFVVFLFCGCKPNNGNHNGNPVIVKLPPVDSGSKQPQTNQTTGFNYDLKTPDRSWKLPSALVEVSGNAWVDKDHLVLIEDLHPQLYLVKIDNNNNVTQEKTIPFETTDKEKFDIEDVTVVDNVVYALWSHGSLFKISNWNTKPEVKEIPTSLTKENNSEGLCYDPVSKKLLIACKDESGIPDEKKSTKAVYQFDIASEKLDPKPFLIIRKKDFQNLAGQEIAFNPSAIAVHPVTHDVYILSTRDNKCMAVFGRDGALKSFQFIDKDLMPQPEGICFSPEGKLYISSEGKKGEPGNLFLFEPKK